MGNPTSSAAMLDAREIDAIAAALAGSDMDPSLFRVVEEIAARRIGVTVFSASTCHLDTMELARIYSSRPDAYPNGVRTSKRETSWARQVMQDRQVFVGEGTLEMAAAFDEQERMSGLGIRSIINVPIVIRDRCAGVLAFGRSIERVAPADVLMARLLGLVAAPAYASRS